MADPIPIKLDPRAIALLRRRRRIRAFFLSLTVLALIGLGASFARRPSPGATDHDLYHQRHYVVAEIVEGDAIRLATEQGPLLVKLIGVDSHRNPAAREMAEWLTTEGVYVYLEDVPTRNRAGELMAYLYLEDGTLVNERLIELGQAFADRRWDYTYQRTFLQAEERAFRDDKGIWADEADPPMPEWRERWLGEMRKKPWKRGEWRRPGEP